MEQTCPPTQSEQIDELATALSAMQKTELFAITDSTNPFFQSKYADLPSVLRAIRIPLTDNGLAISQTTEPYPNGVTLITTLMHTSGQWIRGRLSQEIIPDKKERRTPQGLLALITYLRRAGASAITGLCQSDDDGNSVSGHDTLDSTIEPVVANLTTTGKKMIPYKLFDNDSQAMKDLREYQPDVVILNKETTKMRVGKYTVEISRNGLVVWSDVPKFNDTNFDISTCVPCMMARLIREHGVSLISGKYGIKITSDIKETSNDA